ncbi:7-cyano-7-deazaguanine synthase [Arenicella xantha]|uniref:7-cyano-7-deazaguanine synthase in queuosine biosynthesis n=1 Tax=Arenicella xantha TaxID=644221 RepID=A0A395JQM9_9GAMM|nr:7-cyano-7-deazaguanine synthase [Arenicella xantha]RBP52865.1 7-cyano-7-deazaguanine synthase in queuosine biosynthesis [Arenicella xantha]
MSKPSILCMFSGGIDSTGVLHTLITDEDFHDRALIVHHIILQNRENRAQAEMESVRKIIDFYQAEHPHRGFTYTESVFNTTGFAPLKASRFPFDMDVCAFTAGNISVARKDVRQVAMGRTKTDVESGGDNFQKRMERAQTIYRAVYSLEPETIPEYIFPVINMTKEEIWDSLPEPVQSATWYCRHPQYRPGGHAEPCKKCPTCKEVSEFIAHG